MQSIKKSFADCLSCELLNSDSCIFETNCKDDISKVDIVFVGEHPNEEDFKTDKPFSGRRGKSSECFSINSDSNDLIIL